jgi:hypothetical protein
MGRCRSAFAPEVDLRIDDRHSASPLPDISVGKCGATTGLRAIAKFGAEHTDGQLVDATNHGGACNWHDGDLARSPITATPRSAASLPLLVGTANDVAAKATRRHRRGTALQ